MQNAYWNLGPAIPPLEREGGTSTYSTPTSSTFSAPSWTSSYAGKSITDMASLSRS